MRKIPVEIKIYIIGIIFSLVMYLTFLREIDIPTIDFNSYTKYLITLLIFFVFVAFYIFYNPIKSIIFNILVSLVFSVPLTSVFIFFLLIINAYSGIYKIERYQSVVIKKNNCDTTSNLQNECELILRSPIFKSEIPRFVKLKDFNKINVGDNYTFEIYKGIFGIHFRHNPYFGGHIVFFLFVIVYPIYLFYYTYIDKYEKNEGEKL